MEVRQHATDGLRRAAAELDGAPWELYARGTLWLAWLGLLGAPVAPADRAATTERLPLLDTRQRLAALRERRPRTEPAARDETVASADALRARMTEFAIRHLADATELVTVAVVRRTLPDVSAEVRLHLSAARAALATDHGVDLVLAWLQAAGVTLAGDVTAQLELPDCSPHLPQRARHPAPEHHAPGAPLGVPNASRTQRDDPRQQRRRHSPFVLGNGVRTRVGLSAVPGRGTPVPGSYAHHVPVRLIPERRHHPLRGLRVERQRCDRRRFPEVVGRRAGTEEHGWGRAGAAGFVTVA